MISSVSDPVQYSNAIQYSMSYTTVGDAYLERKKIMKLIEEFSGD